MTIVIIIQMTEVYREIDFDQPCLCEHDSCGIDVGPFYLYVDIKKLNEIKTKKSHDNPYINSILQLCLGKLHFNVPMENQSL